MYSFRVLLPTNASSRFLILGKPNHASNAWWSFFPLRTSACFIAVAETMLWPTCCPNCPALPLKRTFQVLALCRTQTTLASTSSAHVVSRVVSYRRVQYQARNTSHPTVLWPILPIPLSNSPGISVRVDYVRSLPTGNAYIFLFVGRFGGRASIFVVTAVEFTAEGTANILVGPNISL